MNISRHLGGILVAIYHYTMLQNASLHMYIQSYLLQLETLTHIKHNYMYLLCQNFLSLYNIQIEQNVLLYIFRRYIDGYHYHKGGTYHKGGIFMSTHNR